MSIRSNMRSDWRHSVVDLTNDDDADDSDEGSLSLLSMATTSTPRQNVPLPTATRLPYAHVSSYPPLPGSAIHNHGFPRTNASLEQRIPNGGTSPTSSSRPSTATSMGRNGVAANQYGVVQNSMAGSSDSERAAKRVKLPAPGGATPRAPRRGLPNSASRSNVPSGQQAQFDMFNPPSAGLTQASLTSSRPSVANKPPSVQEINRALKTNAESTSVLENFDASSPRALHIGRRPSNSSPSPTKPGANTSRPNSSNVPYRQQEIRTYPQAPIRRQEYAPRRATQGVTRPTSAVGKRAVAPKQPQSRPTTTPASEPASRPSYFAGSTQEPPDEDKDSVLSDVSSPARPTDNTVVNASTSDSTSFASSVPRPVPPPVPAPRATAPALASGRTKYAAHFDTPQNHLLIFLKEVKQYKWNDVTTEYNRDMPHRQYHTLQSHYSSVLNRRDRTLDPPVLILPPRFAAETIVDWDFVHANNAGLRARNQYTTPQQIATSVRKLPLPKPAEPRPLPIQQTFEHDYSSGADSAPRRGRSRRAQRVDYTWPKQRGLVGDPMEEESAVDTMSGIVVDEDDPLRSETSAEEDAPLPGTAIAVDNNPLDINFNAEDAEMGLILCSGMRRTSTNMVPYLSASQRSLVQNPPAGSEWDQLSSRDWQGSLVHVDFSSVEIRRVESAITEMKNSSTRSRHSIRRRELRDILKGFTDSKTLQLVSTLRRSLPCRDGSSITAFLQDAIAGTIAEVPQIQRLAAARPDKTMSSVEKTSTSSILRQRELGCYSKRGWQTASRPLTYQVKNKYMDTLGPVSCWTGASSDIHTVAWAPDGERFAAGAVAVDDPDSMQYNRPNNLLFGDTTHGTIHELAEHWKKREKTESGANSSHAMFVSQDPKLYTTVSSVAFSNSGLFMYSAGYDKHIGIWYTDTESVQPILAAKLNVRDQIDILAVNRTHSGILATAAKVSNEKAIRVLKLDEESPSRFEKLSFHSSKAVSRSDLRILPTALQFEPSQGNLLLAGFGANLKETGFDATGDLCLWDVETQQQHTIHGSSRNVFDIEFNPNRSYGPVFAVGCVANGTVNRGTRSTIRLYDVKAGTDKFTCPIELDCRALDMNDVVWCPHDEHLIAAGCTDGRAYVWDWRWPDTPLRVLSHSRSLMPLQDGVKHEVTDTGVRFLSWGQNATRLYSGSSDGVVKVWDVTRAEENTFIRDLITTDSGIMSGAFSKDYSKLVVGEVNGSVNVLEVGRDDCSIKDADRLCYMPYEDDEQDNIQDDVTGDITRPVPESGIAEGHLLLQTGQLQLAPMGSLPVRQVVQGTNYAGPFDQGVDTPFLRQQALEFQLSLTTPPGPQCDIPACKHNLNKITSEDVGDSGRSVDRIPDELRRQWKAIGSNTRIIPGKSRCTQCSRPALPSINTMDPSAAVLCERCSFACFRCGAVNPIDPASTTVICNSCAGIWDIGVLGYECVQQPAFAGAKLDVPSMKKWSKEAYRERLEDVDTAFGDEMNALTEYYLGLAISRPGSPPL
jgi:WD40 repeat protein